MDKREIIMKGSAVKLSQQFIEKPADAEHRVEIAEVAAEISQQLTHWEPLSVKVTKIIDERTFEITPSEEPVGAQNFWAVDQKDEVLPREQKERLHLQYHRSSGSLGKALAVISALQELCDGGISFQHNGAPLVDMWVLNTSEFDISDILETRILRVRDPVSGIISPAVNTYERMDKLRKLDRKAYRKLSAETKGSGQLVEHLKRNRPTSYTASIPHWWVAAIIEGPVSGGGAQRSMLHIDVCGAAFDDTGFGRRKGKILSLQMFVTPEYVLVPNKYLPNDLKTGMLSRQKFVMDSGAWSQVQGWHDIVYCPQPPCVRHLRCFNSKDTPCVKQTPYIEVTSVNTFVARGTQVMPGNWAQWYRIIAKLRHDLVLQIPKGAPVVIRNLKKRPDLNGRSGRRCSGMNMTISPDRMAISITGVENALSVRTTSVCLTERIQYSSHAAILERVEKSKSDFDKIAIEVRQPTRKEEKACLAALTKDPGLRETFDVLMSGKVTISCFADRNFADNMRKLTKSPFDRILPKEGLEYLTDGLSITDHPKSMEAFKIVNLMKLGKHRSIENNPTVIASDGSILVGSKADFNRLVTKVVKKIKQDKGLTEVFEMMNQKHLFPNPVAQIEAVSF